MGSRRLPNLNSVSRIPVAVPVFVKRKPAYGKCENFGERDRKPNALRSEKFGNQQNEQEFENERSDEGERGGNGPVVERGKKCGRENVESDEEEGNRIQGKRFGRFGEKRRIVSKENSGKRLCEKNRGGGQNQVERSDDDQAFLEQVVKFVSVSRPEMVADKRRASDREADERR